MLLNLGHCVRCRWLQYVILERRVALRYMSYSNHYQVLGIKQTATSEEIRQAFVKLSKQLHPDRDPEDPHLHHKFVRLNEAYSVLSKPLTRKEYDLHFRVAEHERIVRAAAAYSNEASHMPGSGFHRGTAAEERIFWDETIFHMRDKTKDKENEDYYGVKGIRKLPHSYIVVMCVGFVIIGSVLQFMAILKSATHTKRQRDTSDKQYSSSLRVVRERAKLHGNEKQIELLHKQMLAANLTGDDKS